jgi:hypothetical protein
MFDDLFAAAGGQAGPVARLAAGLPRGDLATRAVLMARAAGVPGLEPLAAEVETLVNLLSGRPQLLLPVRIRIR